MNTDEQNLESLKNILRSYGAEEDELDEMIADVQEIVMYRAISHHLKTINNPEAIELMNNSSVSGEEVVAYFQAHKDSIPPLDQKEYEKIATDTWADYFQHMEAHK